MVSSPGLLALFRIVQAGPPQPNGRAGHRIQKAKRQFNSPLRVQRSEVATMPRPDWLALFRMRKTGARKAPHHSASKRRNQRSAQSCDFVRALPCGDSPLVEVARFHADTKPAACIVRSEFSEYSVTALVKRLQAAASRQKRLPLPADASANHDKASEDEHDKDTHCSCEVHGHTARPLFTR